MIKKIIISNIIFGLILISLFLFVQLEIVVALISGFLLSVVFVYSNLLFLIKFWGLDNQNFINIFFLSMGLRFIIVIILFGILIGIGKFDEIYFTVSFIISYLCHSLTEIIFINNILLSRTAKK